MSRAYQFGSDGATYGPPLPQRHILYGHVGWRLLTALLAGYFLMADDDGLRGRFGMGRN